LDYSSPLLNKEHKNNYQKIISEIDQPLINQINNNSPILNTEENKSSIQLENYSRKRPSDSHEKDEIDQSLIILSDSSSQNKLEKNIHYNPDNNIGLYY